MKCPCCKYEYVREQYGYVKQDYIVKSGKAKGQIKQKEVWSTIVKPVGDAEFISLQVPTVNFYGVDDTTLNACPKCGVVFKEV